MNHRQQSVPIALMLIIAVGALLGTGCGSSGPQRAPIKGKVIVAGAPLPAGQIMFVPQPPLEGPATTAKVVNGEYSLPKDQGPLVGLNRVEVQADLDLGFPIDDDQAFVARKGAPLPRNPIPDSFNRASTLTYEVKAGQVNEYEVNVPPGR